jgi:hypothetical protein
VEVAAVDEGDLDRQSRELRRGLQAAAADDAAMRRAISRGWASSAERGDFR